MSEHRDELVQEILLALNKAWHDDYSSRMVAEGLSFALLASDWLAKHDAEVGAKALEGGAGLIVVERRRQVLDERYLVGQDDKHTEDQLALAAVSYALPDRLRAHRMTAFAGRLCPLFWPWVPRYWKPTSGDRTRELVKAGALIAAEIDRIARATTTTEVGDCGCPHPNIAGCDHDE